MSETEQTAWPVSYWAEGIYQDADGRPVVVEVDAYEGVADLSEPDGTTVNLMTAGIRPVRVGAPTGPALLGSSGLSRELASMSDDLIEFVRSQLDHVERVARCPRESSWSVEPFEPSEPGALPSSSWVVAGPDGETGVAVCSGSYVADHIALHDPEVALRDVEAKRRILDRYVEAYRADREIANMDLPEPRGRIERAGYSQAASALYGVVLDLVTAYSDRPGYREEWRP